MQHDHDLPDVAQIEAELARDRATVADTLDALRDRMTGDALMQDAKSLLVDNIGPLTARLDQTVRANPLAVAMIGIGAAWLLFGGRRDPRSDQSLPERTLAGTRRDALIRWEDEGGPAFDPASQDDTAWVHESDSLRDRARDALARIENAAKVGLATVAETAEERADVLSRYASDAARALRRGLEDLPSATQDRLVALREQAYRAPSAAAAAPRQFLEEQPLIAGAVALAMGAGVAAALPRTSAEDRLFGAERDRLMDHAAAMLRAERARAGDVVADLAGTLRHELHSAATRYPRTVGT